MEVSGVIDKVESVERQTKFGKKKAYYVYVDGQKYSNGFTEPTLDKGTEVTVNFNTTKYGKEIVSISRIIKQQPQQAGGVDPKHTALLAASNLLAGTGNVDKLLDTAKVLELYLSPDNSINPEKLTLDFNQ